MDYTEFEDKIIDYINGELSSAEAEWMREQIETSEACAKIYSESKSILAVTDSTLNREPSPELRASFLDMLNEEKQLHAGVRNLGNKTTNSWKMAFQIAASLLLLVAGYGIGNYVSSQSNDAEIATLKQETEELKENVMMALIDNRSASKRIQAVNYVEEFSTPDEEVLEALIDRLQFDASVNVRMVAADALARFSDNESVKQAFIDALSTEKDPGIQIALIQFLVDVKDQRARGPMEQLLEETETPSYVKAQAAEGLSNLM